MMILEIAHIIIICFFGFITDILWALYIKHVSVQNRFKSAIYASLISMCQLGFINSYMNGKYYIIAWILGGFFGTYYSHAIELYITRWRNL